MESTLVSVPALIYKNITNDRLSTYIHNYYIYIYNYNYKIINYIIIIINIIMSCTL